MLKNLTPHNINYFHENGKTIVLPPDGYPVRVVSRKNYGRLSYWPPVQDKTLYIVSAVARERAKRKDFISPANIVRGKDGKVCGCTAFMMNGYAYPVSFKDGKVVTVPFAESWMRNDISCIKSENFA